MTFGQIYKIAQIFLLLKRLATRLSLVSCQKGAWHRAFFFRKVELFSTWKDAGGGVLKSAQDFFENTP